MKMISIAIDGPSGAGKSTMARKVAAELNYLYVDTGAIYRSVSLYAYRAGVDKTDSEKIVSLLPEIHIDMQYQADGIQHMILNGEDVTDAIRQNEVSLYTSAVAAIPAVRAFLLDLQRNLAATHNVIMDGRDIGTVVLPNATVKIYLTASAAPSGVGWSSTRRAIPSPWSRCWRTSSSGTTTTPIGTWRPCARQRTQCWWTPPSVTWRRAISCS